MLQYCNLHCIEGVPIFIRGHGPQSRGGRLGAQVPIYNQNVAPGSPTILGGPQSHDHMTLDKTVGLTPD